MLLENLFKQEVSYMSTQLSNLSNLVYDLEHNALLAKQFMYSIVVAGVFTVVFASFFAVLI